MILSSPSPPEGDLECSYLATIMGVIYSTLDGWEREPLNFKFSPPKFALSPEGDLDYLASITSVIRMVK